MNSTGKNLSLLLGPLSFAIIWWLQPAGLDVAQAKVLGVVAWMLIWWIAESVPMGVTSLLPIILFPLLGVLSLEKTCLAYSNRYVFLFLGGFLIALAMEKWNLHRRLALNIVSRTGTGANHIILGFGLVVIVNSSHNQTAPIVLCGVAVIIAGVRVGATGNGCNRTFRAFSEAKSSGSDISVGHYECSVAACRTSSGYAFVHSPCIAIDEFVLYGLIFSNQKNA